MKNRILIVVVGGLVVVGGAAALFFATRSGQKPVAPPAAVAPTAPVSTPVAPARPAARPGAPASGEPKPTAEAVPTTGTLIIESDVPDTSVFVDRVFLGTAPVTAADLTPGPHRVNLSAAGYEGYAETIDVAAGTRTLTVKFKEVKLDVSIAVVHKHAIGSCSGTLRATPQGLTYDTTNTGDAFTTPLTSLDTFTVDYLEKNLRVKVRTGKTYNFTDAEGKADRLYLFHQTVDKVRQRLLAGR
jgi:flagellar basal body-associated protein FliL